MGFDREQNPQGERKYLGHFDKHLAALYKTLAFKRVELSTEVSDQVECLSTSI